MRNKKHFEFTIKPIPFAILIYFIGWYDFKNPIFGDNITVGFFFMTVSVWILISYLIRFRIKSKNACDECKMKRMLSGYFVVALPGYTLLYWIFNLYFKQKL